MSPYQLSAHQSLPLLELQGKSPRSPRRFSIGSGTRARMDGLEISTRLGELCGVREAAVVSIRGGHDRCCRCSVGTSRASLVCGRLMADDCNAGWISYSAGDQAARLAPTEIQGP